MENNLPILRWLRSYKPGDFSNDLFAGVITAILLVPQGIAYAMLAGLPAQVGLYASILPPLVYAVLGTSRTLSVGPVSIAAIMIASALMAPEISTRGDPVTNSLVLATECGVILLLMSVFRTGMLVNFISHPVLTGFTSGAALLIIFSQLGHLLGLGNLSACEFDAGCYLDTIEAFDLTTAGIGLVSVAALVFFANPLARVLNSWRVNPLAITAISKSGPLLVVVLGGLLVAAFGLNEGSSIATVGTVPAGLPEFSIRVFTADTWRLLLPSACFIALIAYVESVAIAKVTANLRRQRIDPNQELTALGAANLAASFSGGMPVAGGFSRTMVNFSAGAVTQMATIIAAALLALAVIFFTDFFEGILKTSLAAVILVAIAPLVKVRAIPTTLRYNRADGIAEGATFLGVLALGIEEGLGLGIAITLLGYLWRTSRPHIAVVGQVPNTEHFRNVERHSVNTWPELLMIRVDENLTFANGAFIDDFIQAELAKNPQACHLALIFTSVSYIDATALETLEHLVESLRSKGVTLHLSEVKGPVMDKLQLTDFLEKLAPGKVFFRSEEAIRALVKLARPTENPDGPVLS